LGDVFLIHLSGDAKRLRLANPEKRRRGVHHLAYLGIAAQHNAGGRGAHDIIIHAALRGFADGAYGTGLCLCTVQRGARGNIARDQGADTGQFFLGENGAGFGFLGAVPGFTVIQLRHGLARFNPGAFFDQHGCDAGTQRWADLGPMDRFHIARGVNGLHG
jgi:hypothetical protein